MDRVDEIIQLEWDMFQEVNNVGGRASCQNNYPTFKAMRLAQVCAWNEELQTSYHNDLTNAKVDERNLLQEKYARMMMYTHKGEYEKIQHLLPVISQEHYDLVDDIVEVYGAREQEFANNYPNISKFSRISSNFTSTMVYLRGELLTYSTETLKIMKNYLLELESKNLNIVEKINLNTVKFYGYKTLDESEKNNNIIK